MLIELSHLDSPVGGVLLAVSSAGLCALDFTDSEGGVRQRLARAHPEATFGSGPRADQAARRVRAYFDGDLSALEGLQPAATGTEFQQAVWAALRQIPLGATTSYARIAAAIGKPKAVRAVGAANGRNPIALVVPCHRVIAADGTLCGYAGGLWRKQWLLKHERALLA
ncbi:MAG: methylated-DNA--[protein]-cysteine S-methyltransferase [Myxococcaceae bacterium]|nr:methylated-DNA--[protein]-cysteine S-methyltransferase [Myxococcaceae bacterium]